MKTLKCFMSAVMCLILLGEQSATHAGEQLKIIKPDKVDDKLSNVLLVGDSICSGYNHQVRKLLAGKANTYAWIIGINVRRKNIEELQDIALGTADFDVVHFNIGLHGLGDRIPEGEYEPLLRKHVKNYQIHAKGAGLIWASTTPIWDKETNTLSPGNAKIVKRNAIAAEIMKESGIPITDLYSAVIDKLEFGGGIHWSSAGYGIMAAAVAKSIDAAQSVIRSVVC